MGKIIKNFYNLARKEVLECFQQSLDNKVLSVELPGRKLEKIDMHKDFGIIATQNLNKDAFANKRKELGVGFLSRFQRIYFPDFTKDDLINIAKGQALQNKIEINDEILKDIVSFHMTWQNFLKENNKNNLVNEVQFLTIREIEGLIKALSEKENIYDTIMTIYGTGYQKDMKTQLKEKLKKYKSFKDLKLSNLKLDENFPHCFENDNLKDTVLSVLFSLKNERHVIIIGEEKSRITQVARWCVEYFNKKNNETKNKDNQKNYLCLCTNNLQCSDLIGQTRPCKSENDNNEFLRFKPGFLVEAIEEAKTVVFDSINESNASVYERLNGLLDKKNNESEQYFDLPENTQNSKVPIHKNFRLICTCNIKKIKDMSPAFVNRFDVIVLEDQLENINDEKLRKLIANIFISFKRNPKKKIEAFTQKGENNDQNSTERSSSDEEDDNKEKNNDDEEDDGDEEIEDDEEDEEDEENEDDDNEGINNETENNSKEKNNDDDGDNEDVEEDEENEDDDNEGINNETENDSKEKNNDDDKNDEYDNEGNINQEKENNKKLENKKEIILKKKMIFWKKKKK